VYASQRDDGRLTIMLVNLADTEKETTLHIAGQEPETAELWQLTEESLPEAASNATFSDGAVTLPPQSITLLILGN
ncbi:MAG: hypothetical protein WAM60_03240, partial [Candidatus Promineifilaceae bacterium]